MSDSDTAMFPVNTNAVQANANLPIPLPTDSTPMDAKHPSDSTEKTCTHLIDGGTNLGNTPLGNRSVGANAAGENTAKRLSLNEILDKLELKLVDCGGGGENNCLLLSVLFQTEPNYATYSNGQKCNAANCLRETLLENLRQRIERCKQNQTGIESLIKEQIQEQIQEQIELQMGNPNGPKLINESLKPEDISEVSEMLFEDVTAGNTVSEKCINRLATPGAGREMLKNSRLELWKELAQVTEDSNRPWLERKSEIAKFELLKHESEKGEALPVEIAKFIAVHENRDVLVIANTPGSEPWVAHYPAKEGEGKFQKSTPDVLLSDEGRRIVENSICIYGYPGHYQALVSMKA
jgi:hypothetical protein